MGNLLIVANWKSNKTINEAKNWLEEFKSQDINLDNKEVIICPSFATLAFLKEEIVRGNLPVSLGAQDISEFGEGAYTGEINAHQVREFAKYVIIGHSERRKNFNENDDLLNKKVSMAMSQEITPIFCISSADMNVPSQVNIVAYEPIDAIGTGNADSPSDADEVARKIKENNRHVEYVLYGGSVDPDNVSSFTKLENINGVLVGGGSLNASEFLRIIQNA